MSSAPPRIRRPPSRFCAKPVENGVDHIDTSDFYGPHVTNRLIREALHPYGDDLVIVTKVGARRGEDASWHEAASPAELTGAVHDNLRNLGLETLEIVNLRIFGTGQGTGNASIEPPLTALAELQRQGLIRHIGLSNVTAAQIEEGRRLADIVCVPKSLQPRQPRRRRPRRRPRGQGRRLRPLLSPRRLLPPAIGGPVRSGRASRARRRCRWHSPGCCGARPTSC